MKYKKKRKRPNICDWIYRNREEGNRTGTILAEIMTDHFQNLMEHTNPYSRSSKNPKRLNTTATTKTPKPNPSHNVVKLL